MCNRNVTAHVIWNANRKHLTMSHIKMKYIPTSVLLWFVLYLENIRNLEGKKRSILRNDKNVNNLCSLETCTGRAWA